MTKQHPPEQNFNPNPLVRISAFVLMWFLAPVLFELVDQDLFQFLANRYSAQTTNWAHFGLWFSSYLITFCALQTSFYALGVGVVIVFIFG